MIGASPFTPNAPRKMEPAAHPRPDVFEALQGGG
jgi:hypothetical protein